MLSPEIERFCTEWLAKSAQYNDDIVEGCYDKFFTLFIVFNRLYAEATFELARQGRISISPNRSLPDRKGATEYTLAFIGQTAFVLLLDDRLTGPVNDLAMLIEQEIFYIKLSSPNGDPQREKDLLLLSNLRSSNNKKRALAVLDLVYSIRCNLFHGHKAFQPVQVALLKPTMTVLYHVILALQQAHISANRVYPSRSS